MPSPAFPDKMLKLYEEAIPDKILLHRLGLVLQGFWKALTNGIDPGKNSKLTQNLFSK